MVDFALEAERSRGLSAEQAAARSLPGALSANPDDDIVGDARRRAAAGRCGAGRGTAPSARHDHHRRPARLAAPHALHDAGDLHASSTGCISGWADAVLASADFAGCACSPAK